MSSRFTGLVATGMACVVILGAALTMRAQTAVSGTKALNRIPTSLQRTFSALGSRMETTGKEQSTYIGEFVDAAGNRSPARVIYQAPGLVRLDGFKPAGAVVSFDGVRSYGLISRDDEALLETFLMDMPEGMLASIQGAAAVRLLGLGFGPDPRRARTYSGPRYDIYEVTGPVRSRLDQLVRSKLYYFDSQTGLLQSTRYYDRSRSTPVKLETRFFQWRDVEGSVFPGRIDHFEGGQLVFSFVAASIQAGPGVAPEQFR